MKKIIEIYQEKSSDVKKQGFNIMNILYDIYFELLSRHPSIKRSRIELQIFDRNTIMSQKFVKKVNHTLFFKEEPGEIILFFT